jgi:enoyl-CoA hydratase/carnithine racemase
VFVATMDDGENRMNGRWLDSLSAALDEVDAAPRPRALVTTGADRFYSNGLDLDWLLSTEVDMRDYVADVERLFARLLAAPYITVAALNGHTFAAGAMLAMCHDFRVMRIDRGFFCLPEVDIKIPLTPGMNALMTSTLPRVTAREVLVTGRRFGGEEAAARDIVHEAVPEDRVRERAVEIAGSYADKDGAMVSAVRSRIFAEAIALLEDSPGTEPAG